MSVLYRPVLWNRNKYVYDGFIILGIVLYIFLFMHLTPMLTEHSQAINTATLRMRAFGSCAFLMLTLILCIGPLARLDRRFLPLLYNRRHFGVLCFFVALAHANFVLGWYHAFSPMEPWVSVLSSNSNVSSLVGFPFEWLGIAALVGLFVMAATSHDFWLSFLTPPVWKSLHMGVYFAYAAVVMHITLGLLQAEMHPIYPILTGLCLALVIGLHLTAGWRERRIDRLTAPTATDTEAGGEPTGTAWVDVGTIDAVAEGHGRIVTLADGERVALFRDGNRLAALSNVCAHQNGPLGEGRVIDGCVTCPWHGFQYRLEDGRSPPPFTERVPTYRLKRVGRRLWLDPRALPAGTPVPPVVIEEA